MTAPEHSGGPRAVVVHGYESAPGANWFPWLADRLRERGRAVDVVPLPQPDAPDLASWMLTIASRVGQPDDDTVLVAHSLGCVALLRVLAALPGDWAARSLVLVSGFVEPLPNLPELDEFVRPPLTAAALKPVVRRVQRRTVIRSDDDDTVDPQVTARLAALLDARLMTVPGGGHFIDDDGWTRLPAVLDAM